MRQKRKKKIFILSVLVFVVVYSCFCFAMQKPRTRFSPFFGWIFNKHYDLDGLGNYKYRGGSGDSVGYMYCSKFGLVDLGHLKESVDRTFYLEFVVRGSLLKGSKEFSFKMVEPPYYFVEVVYPAGWDSMNPSEKSKILKEVSSDLAAYLAYTSTIWHEIITWYGHSTTLVSEKTSSFSPEDLPSDFLGAQIASRVLKNTGVSNFEKEVNKFLYQELKLLGVQEKKVVKSAVSRIKGKWYGGGKKKRNLDIGFEDGIIMPWLVPGICRGAVPKPLSVPSLRSIGRKHGFSFKLELELDSSAGRKALSIIGQRGKKRIEPEVCFVKMVQKIRKQAVKEKGVNVDKPGF